MRRIFTAAGAAIALSSFAGAVQAEQIYFDFTGTMTVSTIPEVDGYSQGGSISGGFTFETDRLADIGAFGFQHSWLDFNPVGLTQPLAALSFGGRDVTVPTFPGGDFYSMITYVDACTPVCDPNWVENFSLFATSSDVANQPADFTGTVHRTSLDFDSAALTRLPDYPFFDKFDYFDGAAMDPYSIVSLPLFDMVGIYTEETFDCTLGDCSYGQRSFNFSIDSVTRGVRPSAAVPEPGPAALLGAAMFGVLLVGRRRGSARAS